MDDPRLTRLAEPHVKPLTDLIRGMRQRGLQVPNVDPAGAGVLARALFLFETPGPKAVRFGFISPENGDPAAINLLESLAQAGLRTHELLFWNAVPYCVSSTESNRNATARDIIRAVPDTQAFIDAVSSLRVVIFCGRQAQRAIKHLRVRPGVKCLQTFHTGAQAYNHKHLSAHIHATFREVAALLAAQH